MVKLSELLTGILDGFVDVEVKGLTSDSRKVKAGFVFFALSEFANQFIPEARKNGAVAIIANSNKDCNVISASQPKKIYHKIASRFYKQQPKTIVAVTGTNGKTSVVNFCHQLWGSMNLRAASIGTIGVVGGSTAKNYKASLTTPDSADLHCILDDLAREDISCVAIEASSHGIDQYRAHSVKLKAAGFTNISHDHYDYHGDASSYFTAKARLFSEILSSDGVAVLNLDIPEYHSLRKHVGNRSVISYGSKSGDIQLLDQQPEQNGQTLSLNINGRKQEVFLPIIGKFQASNILCAIALVIASGEDKFQLDCIRAVNGRMQLLERNGYRGVIDYAHTPDALKNALLSLRWHVKAGRIILVFGCGGDRDRKKRAIMGSIANELADVVIVCDDNPRTENPTQIRAEILSCCKKAFEIGDRKSAIMQAVNEAKAGDIVLIAGKGSETIQMIGKQKVPFNDLMVFDGIVS